MSNKHKNDDVIDDDVTEDETDEEEDVEEEEDGDEDEDESPLETIVKSILEEYKETLNNYVADPNSPEDVSENDAIKKFIKLKVRAKIMQSFESRQQWDNDAKLIEFFVAHRLAMKKDPNLEAMDAMKQVLRRDNGIADLIERIIDEEIDDDEDEEMETR